MNFNPVLMKWAEKRGGGGGTSGGSVPETEAKTVSLALAGGNQIVTPTDGKLLSEVTIEKPANLLPENIAEGVNIAGVIGALAAAKVVYGAITGNGGSMTITHNLGVVPDLILVYTGTAISNTKTYYIDHCIACSAAFRSLTGTGVVTMGITLYSDSTGAPRKIPFSINYAFDMENTTSTTLPVRRANASTFVLGGTGADSMSPVLHKDVPYKWLAIGRLT